MGVYCLILATTKLVFIARGQILRLDSPWSFAFVVVVPISTMFPYFLAVFTYGLDGDLAARQSMYPPRMFTRPVTTAALVGWPMLYGSAAMMLLWLATRLFALWPPGIERDIPTLWPAFLAISLLAWTQALMWMPYPLPGVRIVVSVLLLCAIDAAVFLWLYLKPRESAMLAFIAPQIPVAYLVARFAVARARCGEIPDWRASLAWRASLSGAPTRRRAHFRSAASAQAWFEWRRHGRSLPAWVAMILPFELLLLWAAGHSAGLVLEIVIGALVIPVFMATFAAASVSDGSSDSPGVAPFFATRPLTSAQLIAAKLTTTVWSTIAAWLIVLATIPIALKLSGTLPVMIERWRALAQVVGMPRAVVFPLLVVATCIASTWKQLVQSLYIGLTGRGWLIKGSVFVTLTLLFLIGPIAQWIVDTKHVGALWSELPVIFAALVCLKMSAAAWILARLWRGRLVDDSSLIAGAALWCVAVLALHGVLAWTLDTPHLPRYLLMLLAILAIPLARLSAAPLALDWNRHR